MLIFQFFPIPGTNAHVLLVVESISVDEEITVKYAPNGYYREGQCLCYSCTGVSPRHLSHPKRKRHEHGNSVSQDGDDIKPKKKVRRGLKKNTTVT